MTHGLPLAVERHGPEPGPETDTFVLLHGFGGSRFTWRHWTPTLARRGHVVEVDLKGFGAAPKPDDGRYTPADQAELIHRLLRTEGFPRVTLVGHSLGGGIALLTALRLRDDGEADPLRRLVLVGSAAYPQALPPFVALGRWPRASRLLLRAVGPSRVIRWTLRSIVHDPDSVTAGQVAGYAGPLDDAPAQRALLRAAAQVVPPDLERLTERYPEVAVPTLLLWGRHDRVVPLEVGRRLEAALPAAQLEILEGCGHMPPDEMPEASLERVIRFLDAHPTDPGP